MPTNTATHASLIGHRSGSGLAWEAQESAATKTLGNVTPSITRYSCRGGGKCGGGGCHGRPGILQRPAEIEVGRRDPKPARWWQIMERFSARYGDRQDDRGFISVSAVGGGGGGEGGFPGQTTIVLEEVDLMVRQMRVCMLYDRFVVG